MESIFVRSNFPQKASQALENKIIFNNYICLTDTENNSKFGFLDFTEKPWKKFPLKMCIKTIQTELPKRINHSPKQDNE